MPPSQSATERKAASLGLLLRTYLLYIILLLGGGGSLSVASAQHPKIKRLVEQAGLKYSLDNNKNFKISFGTGNGRSHTVLVMSSMEEIGTEPVAYFTSIAYTGSEISDETMVKLLMDSRSRKVGNWEITTIENSIYVLFSYKTPLSGLSPSLFRCICEGIASVADNMENDINNGKDSY